MLKKIEYRRKLEREFYLEVIKAPNLDKFSTEFLKKVYDRSTDPMNHLTDQEIISEFINAINLDVFLSWDGEEEEGEVVKRPKKIQRVFSGGKIRRGSRRRFPKMRSRMTPQEIERHIYSNLSSKGSSPTST